MIVKGWLLILAVLCIAAAAGSKPFTVTDANGKIHRLADYRGKWVLVNFWATWCPPCLEEMPDLGSLYDARKDKDLMILGIAIDYQKPREVIEFADNMLVSYPIVLGDKKTTDQFGRIRGLPTTLIYNPRGELVKTHVGAITRQQIERIISGQK